MSLLEVTIGFLPELERMHMEKCGLGSRFRIIELRVKRHEFSSDIPGYVSEHQYLILEFGICIYNNKGAKLLAHEDGCDLKVIISTQKDFYFHVHQENTNGFIAAQQILTIRSIQFIRTIYLPRIELPRVASSANNTSPFRYIVVTGPFSK